MIKRITILLLVALLSIPIVSHERNVSATTPDQVSAAADRMRSLGLVQGKNSTNVDLALNNPITRAELVTVIVRAFGQDSNAKLLTGASSFPDLIDHWAGGHIALAKQLIEEQSGGREALGYANGTFNPDGKVTVAESIAFLMKFFGVARDTTQSWPMDYINGALNAGFITAEDIAMLDKEDPATRGLAFYLADSAFYNTKLGEGGTVYTTFVRTSKPEIKVDEYNKTTIKSTMTLTGTYGNGVTAIYAGSMDNKATIADGKFSATVDLKRGENNIAVTAVDLAGNATTIDVKIQRHGMKLGNYPETTTESKLTITGTYDNGITAIYASENNKATLANGSFSISVDLNVGDNTIAITAADSNGDTLVETIKIHRQKTPDITLDPYPDFTYSSRISISGTYSSHVKAIYIGSMNHTFVLADGKFYATVDIVPGDNKFEVTAIDSSGSTSSVPVNIRRLFSTPPSPPSPPPTVSAAVVTNATLASVYDTMGDGIFLACFELDVHNATEIFGYILPDNISAPGATNIRFNKLIGYEDFFSSTTSILGHPHNYAQLIFNDPESNAAYRKGKIHIVALDASGILSQVFTFDFDIDDL